MPFTPEQEDRLRAIFREELTLFFEHRGTRQSTQPATTPETTVRANTVPARPRNGHIKVDAYLREHNIEWTKAEKNIMRVRRDASICFYCIIMLS